MARRESEQFVLFETYLCEIGAVNAYTRNIRELARLIGPKDRALARSIDSNAELIQRKVREAIATHSLLADRVGYQYMREENP